MDAQRDFAHLLQEYLSRNGRSPIWLAAQLNINPETVAGWLDGSTCPDNRELINQIIDVFDITDVVEQEELLHAGKGLSSAEPVSIHQTNFYGPVHGPVHTGSGNINISPISLAALQEWLAAVFHWAEAPDHMRSSWAGMVIWSLTAVTNRLTPQRWLVFLIAIALWVVAAWLVTPILQWPLADPQVRLWTVARYAAASLIIPLLIGSVSAADNQSLFPLQTGKDRRVLWYLKITGALVGFNTFCTMLLGVSLGIYYLTLSTLPDWAWGLLLLIPLLFSYVVARRIPADRFKMYDGELRAHDADRLFFVVFLFFGPFLAGFVYLFYSFLADRMTGVALLLALMGMVLWEQRQRAPETFSDRKIILALGLFLPSGIMLLYLFLSQQFDRALLAHGEQQLATLLVFAYFLSLFVLWVTLLVRNKPVITLKAALGMLTITAVLSFILLYNLVLGRIVTLVVLALWLLWGRRYFRSHLSIHPSFFLLMGTIGLSFYLVAQMAVPLWVNVFGFITITLVLIYWAYHST
jgi:hypothetical protein